ncbi:MAG: glycosyltransferase family 39 protein [Anaerolineaceae bacterium]|nr:glycosyltransferase family 39 protein [Anaerolineaceae bacterium]
MKSEKIRFWSILLAALILRCVNVKGRSIQYDDAFSILLAERPLGEIVRGTAADTMPPLYYFLLHFWIMLGQQVWFLRLLGILFSLGSVAVLYFIIRFLFNSRAAFWASILTAISPLQIYHAQDIRMYAPLAFFQLAYWGFFLRILEKSTPKPWVNWLGLVLMGALAMYTHNLAVFGLCVPVISLAFLRKWKMLGKFLLADLAIGLLAAPWLAMVPGQISKIQTAFWTPRPGVAELVQAGILFVGTLPLPGIWLLVVAVISLQAVALVLLESWKDGEGKGAVRLLQALAVAPPVLLFAASYLMRPVFVPRGFLVSSFAFLGLAGRAIGKNRRSGSGLIIALLFGVAATISLPYQISFREFPRSPFQEATNYLAEEIPSGAVIVHDNKLSYFPMTFFGRELPQVFLADAPGSPNDTLAYETQKALGIFPQASIEQAVHLKDEIFFVVFTRVLVEYRNLGEKTHPSLRWLGENYTLIEEEKIGDLTIYHFTRPL